MTVQDYYNKVQNYSRDYVKKTWPLVYILNALNDGYLDFATRTHYLRKNGSIALTPQTETFTMPTDCIKPYRFEYDYSEIPQVTDDYLDSTIGYGWREDIGSIIDCVTLQLTGPSTVRIHPVFEDFSGVSYDINDTHDIMIMSYDAGADTSVEIAHGGYSGTNAADALETAINTEFSSSGTVTYSNTTGIFTIGAGAGHTLGITYSGSTAAKRYGILADQADALTITSSPSVRLWLDYAYLPTELSGTSDEPVIASIYHNALFYYTMKELLLMSVGKDEDPVMSTWYETRYNREVTKARSEAMTGFRRANYHSMRKQKFL